MRHVPWVEQVNTVRQQLRRGANLLSCTLLEVHTFAFVRAAPSTGTTDRRRIQTRERLRNRQFMQPCTTDSPTHAGGRALGIVIVFFSLLRVSESECCFLCASQCQQGVGAQKLESDNSKELHDIFSPSSSTLDGCSMLEDSCPVFGISACGESYAPVCDRRGKGYGPFPLRPPPMDPRRVS